MKKRYKLTVAYDGSSYHGWQVQKHRPSIQGTIEKGLTSLTGAPIRLHGSGRTDAGVHALGQTAHFISIGELLTVSTINDHLPPDIRAIDIEEVPSTFHARYSALGKVYTYYTQIGKVADPLLFRFSHHVRSFNFPLAEKKAAILSGTHDFQSFTNVGTPVQNYVRDLNVTLLPQPWGISVIFQGSGFLYKMARNLMGVLLEDRINEAHLKILLESNNRKMAPPPAPAKGLFLTNVFYEKNFR
ncbi:MAG: tRNA pseudouridine(38-40) synthase TruA [Chlamydiota bacterium]